MPSFAAMARVALRDGDHPRALEALTLAQRARWTITYAMPTVALHTRLELAHVHLGLSDVAGARTLMAEVFDIIEKRPDLGVLNDLAAGLREQMRAFRGPPAGGPSTLTAAELRLLGLLPTYLSFREIGERLFVSRNTIKTQAISVYRKLGVSSRSDAVERASELGLLDNAGSGRFIRTG